MEPGDLTRYSGVPWQSDFNECSNQPIDITYEKWNLIEPDTTGDPIVPVTQLTYWWPSHRPMEVTAASDAQVAWAAGTPPDQFGGPGDGDGLEEARLHPRSVGRLLHPGGIELTQHLREDHTHELQTRDQ